ncbi:MAG: type II toxin-antitoxin system antitoxin SocA domain-containing protein [Actinomycetota bacterium]
MPGMRLADEILGRVTEPITAYKLQKLMFYANAIHLVETGQPLAEFKAYENGPVCPEVFNRFKGRRHLSSSDGRGDSYPADSSAAGAVDEALAIYGGFSADALVEMTHSESPWIEAWGAGGKWIDESSIRDFYGRQFAEERAWRESLWADPNRGMVSTELAERYAHLLN